MHASIRTYPEDADLADQLTVRRDEIAAVVAGAAGFRAHYLLRSDDAIVSITICDDQGGVQDSNELAAAWLKQNLSDRAEVRPELAQGSVLIAAVADTSTQLRRTSSAAPRRVA